MSTQRHLHRTAVFVTASLVFAASATGTAFAWVRSDAGSRPATVSLSSSESTATAAAQTTYLGAAAVVPTASPSSTAVPSVAAVATPVATPTAKAVVATPTAKAAVKKVAAAKPATDKVTISHYVDNPGSQAAIDKCNLVLWTHSPMWLAGHNWCGFQWMAYVPTGTTVTVTTGAAAGTYVVTGHVHLSRQSGALPNLDADLVLQTCIGSGTGLTLLQRA